MENESFGSIFYKDKMVNLDRSNVQELEKISEDLDLKEKSLKSKVLTVFKQ